MRLCRYRDSAATRVGFYEETRIIPLSQAARALNAELPDSDSLLPYLPGSPHRDAVRGLEQRLAELAESERTRLAVDPARVSLLAPDPAPTKLLMLAGNYADHIRETGGKAEERARTFPYVFMKPPLTTLIDVGEPIRIPAVSPDHIDWELELGVIIGRRAKGVGENEALDYVAGYTAVIDVSDRQFRPNPDRAERDKDRFFDWLHGKWHDTFCPTGPCVLPADELPDPQSLKMTLKVNGQVEQDGSTGDMVFPVAAVVSFISSFVTLEPGDLISTGTPAGVGKAKGKYLKAGDRIDAHIENIGTLEKRVE